MSKWIVDIYGDIEGDYEIVKKYEEPKIDDLDKIRAEVEKLQKMCDKNDLNLKKEYGAFGLVLDIIDNYKTEKEISK